MRTIIVATPHDRNDYLVKLLLETNNLNVVRIRNQNDLTVEFLDRVSPEYVFFPHWSWLIPNSIYTKFECVVFHMTDLPFGRGGSPLQNLISRGIYETQVSALKCVKEVDAGPIYLKRPLSLHGTAEEILLRVSSVIGEMILYMLANRLYPAEQVGDPIKFERLKPSQGNLLDVGSLSQAFDRIRMLDADGYPSAFIDAGNFRFEFTRASLKSDLIIADVKISIQKKSTKEKI
jgi:methionyl-tRNA formyltransferase